MTDPRVAVDRRVACSNDRFDVFLDRVAGEGEDQPAYLVVAPRVRAEGLVTGVAVLPICDGQIGLLRIYRHPIGDHSWEMPRGFVEAGESVEQAALRELEEETGLACEAAKLESLGLMTPDAGVLAARVHLFVAHESVRVRSFEAAELGHRLLRFFSSAEIDRMVDASEIQDSYTLAACLWRRTRQPGAA